MQLSLNLCLLLSIGRLDKLGKSELTNHFSGLFIFIFSNKRVRTFRNIVNQKQYWLQYDEDCIDSHHQSKEGKRTNINSCENQSKRIGNNESNDHEKLCKDSKAADDLLWGKFVDIDGHNSHVISNKESLHHPATQQHVDVRVLNHTLYHQCQKIDNQ